MTTENIWKVLDAKIVFGNSLWQCFVFILFVAAVFIGLRFFLRKLSSLLLRISERYQKPVLAFMSDLCLQVSTPVLGLVTIYIGVTLLLPLGARGYSLLFFVVMAALFVQFALWGDAIIDFIFKRELERKAERDPSWASSIAAMKFVARAGLWIGIILVALDTFGINVTTFVAGLGVGGVAIALAVQNILGDLLNSFSIILDKPFEVGDFVIVGDKTGVVERIGIKSTRLRSLQGEQVVISNSDLIGSRIQNFKRMKERRIVFQFGVVYETPVDTLEKIPQIVREIVEGIEKARFDRAHFFRFGESSLDFEVVYYVEGSEYILYMDIQQRINLALMRRFAEQKVGFAYPTRTVFLKQEGASLREAPPE